MKKLYNICDLAVECDFRCPTMTARAEKYLSAGSVLPAITVRCSPESAARLKAAQPGLTDDECEIVSTAEEFYYSLLRFGGFMLHSSAVVMDGEAYLFSAPSGTGKSTHTALWLETFGGRARILNDDKPAIMVENGSVTACGTPWSGKSDLNLNLRVPLRGICMLERSKSNFIQPLHGRCRSPFSRRGRGLSLRREAPAEFPCARRRRGVASGRAARTLIFPAAAAG